MITAENTAENEVEELEEGAEITPKGEEKKTEEKPEVKPPTTNELQTAMTELASTVKTLAEPKKEEPKALTTEELNELWAVYDPEKGRPDFLKKFFRMNPDATPEDVKEMKEIFADMQKGFTKQSLVGARHFISIEVDKLREEFKGISEFVLQQKAEKVRENFNKAYPVLADQKYSKIVAAKANELKDKEFQNDADYFKALAEGAADAIKDIIPDFDLGAKVEEKKTAGTTPKLPRTTQGGGGGAGAGGGPRKVSQGGDIDSLDD